MPRKPTSKELLQKVSILQDENRRLKERVTRFENLIENAGISPGVYDPDGVLLASIDITERKKAEEALRAASVYARTLIEASLDPLVTISPDGKITDVNQATELVTGVSRERLIDSDFSDYFTDPEKAREGYRQVFSRGTVKDYPLIIRHSSGRTIDVVYNASVYRNEAGEVQGVFAAVRDITLRKRAEEILHAHLRLLLFTAGHSLDELLQQTLDEVGALTDSPGGFYHFVEADQKTLSLQAWSTRTIREFCTAEVRGRHYDIAEAGVWVDCIHQRRAVIHNDYAALPHRKGLPPGHASVVRELVVPIFRKDRIVAVLGVGNKPCDYTEKDVDVVTFMADVAWEVAERKRAEEALKQAEERYRGIFENAVEGIFQTTTEGRYLSANPALAKMHGYDSPHDLIASVSDVGHQHHVNPENRTRFGKALEEHGSVKDFVTEVRRKDGSRFWVSINARAVRDSDGGTLFYEGTVEDISEHRRMEEALRVSEEQYRKLFEGALDGIAFADPDTGILLDCNAAFLKLVERERDEVVGKSQKILHPPENALRDVTRSFEQHRTTGQGQVIATKLLTKTGKLRDVEVKANFAEIGNRKVLQGVFRDITDRVKADQEREQIRSQLYQAQKMESLGVLVAGVAHEINNPINLIMFNVPLLQKVWRDIQPILEKHALHEPHKKYGGLTSEFLKQDLDKLLRDMDLAANRVATIVSGLKDFAKMSDIRDKTPIQINQAVTNSVRLAQTTLKKAGIDVELELRQDLPLIEANLQGIEQIVLNLIVNASQAIENENGRIRVKTGLDERKGQIVVVVSDNGRGIDPSTYGRIFDPFFTSRQAYGGTGLGLAVSYSMAKAHDGEISFESEVGRGTTFTVTLPVTPRGKRARVLVADDDELLRDLIASAFAREQGYSVELASTGTEALLKIGSFRPDLVVLDVFMPDTDGLEVCRALKKDPSLSGIKVIIMTGHADHPKLDQIKRLGFEWILGKPLHVGDLLHEADKILGEGERGNRQ